jgi:nucleotide-binding universal stress UspA family protein
MGGRVQLRRRPPIEPAARGGARRPVLLATLAVPFDAEAARVAIDAALESASPLVVVDAVELPHWPLAIATGHAELEEPDDLERIRALAGDAQSLGLAVTLLRVRSPRPVDALIEVAAEREAALLVLGPDRTRVRRRALARAARRVRRKVTCLVWVAGEGP